MQLGFSLKENFLPELQVTLLLPLLRTPGSEHVTSTTVAGSAGNLVAVVVPAHSELSARQDPEEKLAVMK